MKKFFPSLNKYKNSIFCDNAGGSQVPEQVLKRLNDFIVKKYVQPGGNNIFSKELSKDLLEINNVTNIFFNNVRGNIVYGNSCSQLVYNLANSLENIFENGDEIVLADFSHEACNTPFERIANKNNVKINWWSLNVNNVDNVNNVYDIDYKNILKMINNNTKLVVLPHVSNLL